MGSKQQAIAILPTGATHLDAETSVPCAAKIPGKPKCAVKPAARLKQGAKHEQADRRGNRKRRKGQRGAYAGHVEDFRVPPDHECIPAVIAVGAWVYTCFKEYDGYAHRGIITNRVKRTSMFVVRFQEDDETKKPSDYDLEQSVLFKTREEAEKHSQQTDVYDFKDESDDGSDCSGPPLSTH